MQLAELVQWLIFASLAITAIAIFWYSYETRKMRKEMFNQNELLIMPKCTVYISGEQFVLLNVGFGPAMNIKVDDLELIPPESSDKYKFCFKEIHGIDRGIAIELAIDKEFKNAEEVQKGTINCEYQEWTIGAYKLNITYTDIKGSKEYKDIIICEKLR